jgi:hypothetical protein
VTRFDGGGGLEGASTLDYEETLEALLSLIGRSVLVSSGGTASTSHSAGSRTAVRSSVSSCPWINMAR